MMSLMISIPSIIHQLINHTRNWKQRTSSTQEIFSSRLLAVQFSLFLIIVLRQFKKGGPLVLFIGYFLVTFCMISSISMIFDICDSISFKGFSIENFALKVIGPKTSLMVELLMVFAQIGIFVATILFTGNLNSRICGISSLQTRNNGMLYQTSVHRNSIDCLYWFGVYWIHKSVRDCFLYLQHFHVCNKCFNEYLPLFSMRSFPCHMIQ